MVIKLWGPIFGLVGVSMLAGCTFPPLDLSDRGCDCAAGWVCVEDANRCVERSATLDGGIDATDSGHTDASSTDAGADRLGADTLQADAAEDGGSDADARADAADVVDSGTPVCDGADGVLVCETFEMVGASWFPVSASGSVSVSSTFSRSPENSLRAATTSPDGFAAFKRTDLPTLRAGETFYVRLAVYPPDDGGDFSFARVGENLSPFGGVNFSIRGGALEAVLLENFDRMVSENSFRFAEWNCVEARVLVGQAGMGEVEFRLNSGPPSLLSAVDTLPPAGYEAIVVGIPNTGATTPSAVVYIDDVVVSSSPVPCDS